MRRILLIVVGLLGLFGCANDRTLITEFQERKITIGNVTYAYRVFVPEGRNPNERIPVMLYLHGSGVRGDDNVAQADAFALAVESVRDKIKFVVVIPQCRNDTFWASREMASYALGALDQSVREFNGDDRQLYLAGFSLGGYGTWQIAAANPGKFAALMPVAGGVVGERPIAQADREAIIPSVGEMLDSEEPYKATARAIGSTPVWAFHGAKDEAVPVAFSRTIVQALKGNGSTNVKYTEYRDEGHMIFAKSFAEPGFLEWLIAQKRK